MAPRTVHWTRGVERLQQALAKRWNGGGTAREVVGCRRSEQRHGGCQESALEVGVRLSPGGSGVRWACSSKSIMARRGNARETCCAPRESRQADPATAPSPARQGSTARSVEAPEGALPRPAKDKPIDPCRESDGEAAPAALPLRVSFGKRALAQTKITSATTA